MSSAAVKNAVTVLKEGDGIYFADIAQFADKNGYITYTCDGGGVVDIDGVGKFQLVTEDATGKTFIFPESTWNSMVQTGYTKIAAEGSFYSDVKVTDSRQVFTEDEILARYVSSSTPFYFIGDTQETNLHNIPANTVKVAQKDAYDANVVFTDRGYDTLNTVDIEDADAVLEEKVENGVVYLYDYFYDSTFPSSVSPERFAKAGRMKPSPRSSTTPPATPVPAPSTPRPAITTVRSGRMSSTPGTTSSIPSASPTPPRTTWSTGRRSCWKTTPTPTATRRSSPTSSRSKAAGNHLRRQRQPLQF